MQDIIVRVKTEEQLTAVLSFAKVRTVIADYGCAQTDVSSLKRGTPETKILLQLPDVLREKKEESVRAIAERAAFFDGIVIKNLDEIGLLETLMREGGFPGPEETVLIGDSFLYATNTAALSFYRSRFPGMKFILNDELSDRECALLIRKAEEKGIASASDFIYKAYGYQPLMITNQCLSRNYAGCSKPKMEFADEKRNRFFITSECSQCYAILYNGLPTSMLDKLDPVFPNLLLDFTIETEEEVKRILSAKRFAPEKLTRGHHYKEIP